MNKLENVLPLSSCGEHLTKLVQTIARLRDPKGGCPWDLEQTFDTLRKYMLEEAYEASAAMTGDDAAHLCDELGDVLLQVVLNAQIASEDETFTLTDVIDNLNEKMIRRHPHVFAKVSADTSDQVVANWEKIKEEEQKLSKKMTKVMPNFPALTESVAIGKMTSKKKFDWDNAKEVIAKVKEELAELEEAIDLKNKNHIEEELGDLLFSAAQLGRHLKIDPETAAQSANVKFMKRFDGLGRLCEERSLSLESMSLGEKEQLWREVKTQSK